MDIKNKTSRPIRVPLPAGKRLFLPPGGVGQITPKAAEHPPVQALVDAGDLELQVGSTSPKRSGSSGGAGKGPGNAGPSSGGVRHTGDR
jgi:hypothetical protein